MLKQNLKALLLILSATLTILAIGDWTTDEKSYSGLLGGAFIILLLSNVLDLIFAWKEERRKFDWGIDERELNRLLTREAE